MRRRCHACQIRYPQSRLGLCRRCEREVTVPMTLPERLALNLRNRLHGEWSAHAPLEGQPLRTRVDDGVTFDVMWDGTR
jgi:hypothetical protein